MDPKLLYMIEGLPNGRGIPVLAIDDNSFFMRTSRYTLTLRDDELKETDGKFIINIEKLDLKAYYPDVEVPKEFEFPKEVIEARAEKRRLKALAKDAIYISYDRGAPMYFYSEGDKLRILFEGKEVIAENIDIIHGRKAVKVESLELGHPYLELPAQVALIFEKVMQEKELKTLGLTYAGKSLLNGKKYYGFTINVPVEKWDKVKENFEEFGSEGELTGFLTCEPGSVAEILDIPINFS